VNICFVVLQQQLVICSLHQSIEKRHLTCLFARFR